MEVVPEGMTLPSELEFGDSKQEPGKIGIWTRKQVNKGRLYGPFKGEKKRCTQVVNDTYSWQIIGPKGRRFFCVDASDPKKGNWMRYVKTAPDKVLHNLHPLQHKKKIYYKVIKTISSGTELLCWYEGATSNGLAPKELLPMPILEKMDFANETSQPAPQRLAPLEALSTSVPEGLEPPLISPAYPVCHPGDTSQDLFSKAEDLVKESLPSSKNSDKIEPILLETAIAIQAPDVTSTGEVADESEMKHSVLSESKNGNDLVTSSQTMGMESVLKKGKGRNVKNYKNVRKKQNFKNKRKYLKQPLHAKGAIIRAKKVKDCPEIKELYIIGPESIVKYEDGEERYMCQMCGKQCKYPAGLKIHLRTYHHCTNVQIKGIAQKPWARGITLKRQKDQKLQSAAKNVKDESWNSVDCSMVQSALEKLKDDKVRETTLQENGPIKDVDGTVFENHLSSSVQNSPDKSLSKDVKKSFDMFKDGDVSVLQKPLQGNDFSETPPKRQKVKLKDADDLGEVGNHGNLSVEMEDVSHIEENLLRSAKVMGEIIQANPESEAMIPLKDEHLSPIKGKSSTIFPKKFSCHLCHQAFAYKVWRDRHLRMHSESQTGHECDVCDLRFFSKKDLVSHQRTLHGELNEVITTTTSESDSKGSESEAVQSPLKTSTCKIGDVNVAEHKAKGNRNLEKLVQTLQRIKDKDAELADSNRESNNIAMKEQQASKIYKIYPCRVCGSIFSNPSNRSRHMREIHRLSTKKTAVKNLQKEKVDEVVTEGTDDDWQVTMPNLPSDYTALSPPKIKSPSPRKQASNTVRKSTSTSPKKTPSPKKTKSPQKQKLSGEHHFWRKVPRTKIKENKTIAHQKSPSKSRPAFDALDYQEFPRTPDISCPWDRLNLPAPFVPRPKDVPSFRLLLQRRGSPKRVLDTSQEKGEDGMLHGDAMDLSINGVRSAKPRAKHFDPLDLSKENPSDSHRAVTTKEHKYTPKKSKPSKQAKQVRPRVKITSNMSSKKYLKHGPPMNPVKWLFTCNICTCSFMSIRELSHHVVAHAEDYPYKCEFCMHVFPLSDQLRDHKEDKHSVKKMYNCSICKQEFAYLSNLQNHQREAHNGIECSFGENFCNDVRPQNFTDPTKAFNLRAYASPATERVSYLKEEMSKLTPMKHRMTSQMKEKVATPKKPTPEKGMLFNPQRHHPFEQRRKIGFLSMLSDPRNQKQLGSKVSNVCTKCLLEFKDTSAFHVHIMECANIKEEISDKVLSDSCQNSKVGENNDVGTTTIVENKSKKSQRTVKNAPPSKRGRGRKRAKPGSITYDPQKYIRAKSVSAFDDIHACAGCGRKFYFINKLERHMKMCPNREKIVNAHKSNVALALRKRPRINTMQHKCTNCDKHFTYLGSLEKHLLLCTRNDISLPVSSQAPKPCDAPANDYANNVNSLPQDNIPEIVTGNGQSENGNSRRKRRKPFWKLPKNSL